MIRIRGVGGPRVQSAESNGACQTEPGDTCAERERNCWPGRHSTLGEHERRGGEGRRDDDNAQ